MMRHHVRSIQHSIQHSVLCPQFSTLALLPALPSPGPSPSPDPGPSLKLILAEGKQAIGIRKSVVGCRD